MNNESNIINLSNCKNCGSPRDVYRTSCEYCDTFYNDKQHITTDVKPNCSGLLVGINKDVQSYNGSGLLLDLNDHSPTIISVNKQW